MIKSILNIIISGLFFVSTTGFTVSWHYCGDVLQDISLNTSEKTCCDDTSCCHNESVYLKLEESFLSEAGKTEFKLQPLYTMYYPPLKTADNITNNLSLPFYTYFGDSPPLNL